MKKWYYPLLAGLFGTMLLLPLRVLYLLSDLVYLVLYHVVGYRKQVVFRNLENSFPEKSREEIREIAGKYYRHMVDVVFETLKLATISKKELLKRHHFNGLEIMDRLKESGQSFLFVLGHMGNWESIGPAFSQLHPTRLYALYHPLSNRFFNWYIYRLRTRFGGRLIPMNSLLREMAHLKNEYCAIAFISDQTPLPEHAVWLRFLNQDTPVFAGTERIARKFNYPVIYASVKKPARGHYTITMKVLTYDPSQTPEGFITAGHTRLLEEDIRATPHIWLWSHRRWKHKRPSDTDRDLVHFA